MRTEFFDTHAHLDFPEFRPDLPDVVQRATEAGITRILTIGTTLRSSRRAIELAGEFDPVFAVVGVHPNHVEEESEDVRAALRELATHPKVVALGETGLDLYRVAGKSAEEIETLRTRQRHIFEQHLEVAAETGLPCVIHQREAFGETLSLLAAHRGRVRGVFHCFTGTPAEAAAVRDSGSLVSFTGITTFKNATNVRETLVSVPEGQFMLETDCPFLAPVPHRGRRCEPAYVADLAEAVATLRGCSLAELSAMTCATAREFFPKLT